MISFRILLLFFFVLGGEGEVYTAPVIEYLYILSGMHYG